ncbi:MAG TPA: DUF1015 domain-containing protein [Actinomycetota bacterium]|nr:DUF1015 domain-containing protein [Actinomycetota bacterium]
MPTIRPFAGLLYDQTVAGPIDRVSAPPYDTISPIDQERYHRASPYNVVRLILGTEEPGDDGSENKYTRAASYLQQWRSASVLRPTNGPALFPYEVRFHHGGRERSVRGLIAEVELEPWGGSILPHERTMPGPIEDRLKLLRAVRANLSPVYGVFGGPSAAVSELIEDATTGQPDRELTDENGTLHRLWVAQGEFAGVTEALQQEQLLIADGHHRYTVALAYRDEMRARHGSGPWDAMMMLIVDGATEAPPVLPIHRVASGGALPQPDAPRVRDLSEVLASLDDDELTHGLVTLEDGEAVHRVGVLKGSPPTVCQLHEQVLDPSPDLSLRFVPDAVAAEQAVLSGAASAAFLLPPTRVDRVRGVIERGDRLPQKSTYFWPKPRTGLVIRPFD